MRIPDDPLSCAVSDSNVSLQCKTVDVPRGGEGSLTPSSPRSDSWVGGVRGTFVARLFLLPSLGKFDKILGDCAGPDASLDTMISLATCKLLSVEEASILAVSTAGFFFGGSFS